MKKNFILLSYLIVNQVFSQSLNDNFASVKDNLENGIFIRTINLQFVNSIDDSLLKKKYKKRIQLRPWDTKTYNFLRFSAFQYDEQHDVFVGKVFLSNRYLMWDFRKKYPNHESMMTDKNGYFMTCKLYKIKNEVKLNIYPELLTNIYKKNFCSKKEQKALGIDQLDIRNKDSYFEALKRVILIRDAEATDFIAQPQDPKNMIETGLLNKEMGLRINFKKQIKIFEVVQNPQRKLVALELHYNKYAFSDDLVENNYRYDFVETMPKIVEKTDTTVWILAGVLSAKKKSKNLLIEDISTIQKGDSILVKGEVQIYDEITSKNIVEPHRTMIAEKWKVMDITDIDDNKKKLRWIKIQGKL